MQIICLLTFSVCLSLFCILFLIFDPPTPFICFLLLPVTLFISIAVTVSFYIYIPVTKGRDLKWDTLPQNQTPSKLFSVLPLESGMFQVTISIIKKWF